MLADAMEYYPSLEIDVLWHVMPCSLVGSYRPFGEECIVSVFMVLP